MPASTHFVYSSSSLPPPKQDAQQLPARIPTGSQLSSTEFGVILQAIYDIRDTLHSASFHAFQRQAPGSLAPITGTLGFVNRDFLWVDSSGSLLYRTKTGDKVVVSGSG